MVVVHRLFRREFDAAPELVRGVAAGDTRRSEIVGEYVTDLLTGLHHHHTGEDELLWPVLVARVGGLDRELVERMESQHETVAKLMSLLHGVLPTWRATATMGAEVADVLGQLTAALNEHLTDEETHVLPLVSQHITQSEWDALGRHGRTAIPKGRKGFVFLGAILSNATPTERTRFLSHLPAPVRLAWRIVGPGIHRRGMARVHG